MQSLTIPTGPRNPNGYTSTEILAALQATSGYREFSFRYERLSSANVKLDDLDNVLGCSIEQNWLADIKKVANFVIEDTGNIDYLQDRIKPWVQLKIPYTEEVLGLQLTGESGSYAWTSSADEFDITGDLELIVDCTLPDYRPDSAVNFVGKWIGTSNQRSYRMTLASDGILDFLWSTDGTSANQQQVSSFLPVPTTHGRTAFRVLFVDNDPYEVTLFVGDTADGPWTPLGGTEVGSGATNIFSSTAKVEVGSVFDGTLFNLEGTIHEVRINGYSIDFTRYKTKSATVKSEGIQWTISSPAQILNRTQAKAYVEWPQGVFLLSTPTRNTSSALVVSRPVTGYDALQVFLDDKVSTRYTIAAGTVYTTEISTLLGSIPKNIEFSDSTLPTAREYEPGTAKLRIINDLLSALNYNSLSFDPNGVAIVRSYTSPSERAAEYTYADNEVSLMYPEVMQELDLFSIANQWTLVVSDPEAPPLSSTYTNNDPASPTSTVRRQRTIVDFRTEEDAANQAALDAKVERLAFEASQIFEAIEFKTGMLPIHDGNDVYKINFSPLAVDAKYAEHTWTMTLEEGVPMTHRARRVVTI